MSSVGKSTKVYSGFAPTQIPGCALWLDAADPSSLTLSGSSVTQWRDKSGNGNHTTGSSGTTTYRTNGISTRGSLYFNSTYLTGGFASTFTGTEMSCFIVASVSSSSSQYSRLLSLGRPGVPDQDSTSTCIPFVKNAGVAQIYAVNNNVGSPPNNVAYDTPFLSRTYFLSNLIANNVNGSTTFNTVSTTASFNITSYGLGISTSTADASRYTGEICEIICYFGSSLTTSQAQQIEGYLAQKWGLASVMPATHPFGLSIAPSPQSFSPTDLTGCAVWLDAYKVNGLTTPADNSSVSSWVNLVGGSNFTQATSSRRPTFLSNGLTNGYPAVFFNSSNTTASIQYLFAGPNVQTTKDVSVFYVSRYTDVGGGQTQLDLRKDAGGIALRTFKVADYQIRDSAGNLYTMSYTPTTAPSIKSYRDTLNTIFGYLNGSQVASSTGVYDQQAADSNGIYLGCHFDSYNNSDFAAVTFSKVYFSEVIIYNRYLSIGEQQQVEGYLAWKWGLIPSIPSPHPYKLALPYVRQFSPRDIAGCILWLDAADTSVFNGGSTWTDKSGTGNHAVNGTPGASAMPTVTTWSTGTNAARFVTASKNSMKTTNNIPNLNVTYFVVARMNDVTALGRIMINNVDGQRQINATANFPSTVFGYGSGSAAQANMLSVTQSQAFQVCLTVASGSTGFIGYGNGTLGGNTNTSTSSPSKHYFGSADSDGGYMSGDIAEILIYNTVLSTAQRQQVEGYLAWKWNLTTNLPAAHPFEDKPPYAQPFLPTNIAGCSMWLDAADTGSVVLSGSNVTQWSDKSGNGRNAVVSSTAFATYSNSGLYFANSLYTTTLSASPTSETLFLVFNNTSSSNTGAIIGAYGGGREIANYDSNRTVGIVKAQIAWGPYANFPAFNAKYMAACIVSPTATKVIVNGGTSITTGSAITFSSISNTILGREAGVDFGVTGIMHEVISFNSVLSDTQRQQIEGYLAWKWGLTSFLSVGHPFKYSAPSYYIPPFTPTDLVGCALWLDAADSTSLTLSGSNVSAWRDKSPSSLALTLTGTPTWSSNSVNFTGTQYFTNSTISLNLSAMTVFLVGHTLSGSQNGGFMSFVPIPNGTDYNQSNAIAYTIDTFTAGTLATTFNYGVSSLTRTYTSPTNPFLFTHVQSGTAMTLYGLGTSFYTTTTNFTPGTTTGLTIGARYQTGNGVVSAYLTGNVKEILIYNTALTTTQRQMVENYLAWKWGLNQSLVVRPNVRPLPLYTRPINPLDITGCALWLDAADATSLTLSGSNVTAWADKSGNARNATGYNNTATYNASGLNTGYPGLEFSSTKSMRSSVASGVFSTAVSGFVVYKFTGSVNLSAAYGLVTRTVSSTNGAPTPFDMYSYNGASYRLIGNGTSYTLSTASPNYITNTTPTLYTFGVQSSANTTWNESINGTSAVITTSGGTGATYGDTGSFVVIGGRLDTAVYFQGVISEVIFYNTALTTTQRQQIEAYLAWKWGLIPNIPAPHPFKRFPSLTTTFAPAQLSGLSLWLDAADPDTVVTTAAAVTQWRDKSGNGRHTAAATSGIVQGTPMNGLRTLRFPNGESFTTPSFAMSAYARTFFCVMRITATPFPSDGNYYSLIPLAESNLNTGGLFYSHFRAPSPYGWYVTAGCWNVGDFPSSGPMYTSATGLNSQPVMFTVSRSAASTGYISYNGTSYTPSFSTTNAYITTSLAYSVPRNTTNLFYGSEICEIIYYNAGLTTPQIQQVEGYLAWKWGLVGNLPSTHPYKKFTP
jgi:hypothetical protein